MQAIPSHHNKLWTQENTECPLQTLLSSVSDVRVFLLEQRNIFLESYLFADIGQQKEQAFATSDRLNIDSSAIVEHRDVHLQGVPGKA